MACRGLSWREIDLETLQLELRLRIRNAREVLDINELTTLLSFTSCFRSFSGHHGR